jgi:hypothetical protein
VVGLVGNEINGFQSDEITATQFAVERGVEQCQVSEIARKFWSGTNGWFSRRAVAPIFTLTQHFSRCERMQRENRIHTQGSSGAFAA